MSSSAKNLYKKIEETDSYSKRVGRSTSDSSANTHPESPSDIEEEFDLRQASFETFDQFINEVNNAPKTE